MISVEPSKIRLIRESRSSARPARGDRLGRPANQRFLAAAPANLHEVIDHSPGSLRAPEFAEGGLHPEVDPWHRPGGSHPDHRVGGVGIGSHVGDLRGDGFVTADFRSPLASFHTHRSRAIFKLSNARPEQAAGRSADPRLVH